MNCRHVLDLGGIQSGHILQRLGFEDNPQVVICLHFLINFLFQVQYSDMPQLLFKVAHLQELFPSSGQTYADLDAHFAAEDWCALQGGLLWYLDKLKPG